MNKMNIGATIRRLRRSRAGKTLMILAYVLVLAPLLLLPSIPVHAATFTVTKTADTNDGTCDAADCSLREAIVAANAAGGADTITLPAGTYILTIGPAGDDSAARGDLDITDTDNLTIIGAGEATTIIDGNYLDRVFDIRTGAGDVSFSDVTIRNGNVPGNDGGGIQNWDANVTLTNVTVTGNIAGDDGGGIFHNSGTLTLNNSTVSNNTAGRYGGGIYHRGGTLTLSSSTVSGNTTGTDGGGIENDGGTVTISDSTVSGNSAGECGGGINNSGGNLTLTNCTVSGNEAGSSHDGGGIKNNQGTVTISDSTVSNNTAGGNGGGIDSWNDGVVTLSNSTVSGNTADQDGGGILNDFGSEMWLFNSTVSDNTANVGGGISNCDSLLEMLNSTVSGNAAGTDGGGILNANGVVTLSNSTVSDNTANVGGGISNYAGTLTLTNVTLTDNSADEDGGGLYARSNATLNNVTIANNRADSDNDGDGDGGGIYVSSSTPVNVSNSIIAGNVDPTSAPDCSGTITSQGYNLIQDTTGCTIAGTTTGNITGQDPLLGPLQDNGGPTQTRALLAGSPAINAGNPAPPTGTNYTCETTDQRGVARPQSVACDMGAYEAEISVDLSVTKTDTPDPVYAGNELFYDINVHNAGPSTAYAVVVTDTLPISVTYIADTAGCTHTPGTPDVLVCTLDDIAPGASRSFQIKTRVAANAVANEPYGTLVITNTAEVRAFDQDTNSADNTVIEGTFVEDLADLEITKLGKPDGDVQAGEYLTYTLFIDNLGPSFARNVVVTDTMLSDGTFTVLSATSQGRSGSCSPTVGTLPGTFNQQAIITCQLTENLEPASPTATGRWTIQIVVTADETVDVNNTARVTSDTPDPVATNNDALTVHSFTDTADLELTKIASTDVVTAGLQLDYTLTITNNGPSTAVNVVVKDFLPSGVTVVNVAKPAGASCTTGTPGDPFAPLTCNLGTLAVETFATVTVTVRVDPDYPMEPGLTFGYLENDAVVSSYIFDPNDGNDRAYTITQVNAFADLGIAKADNPDSVVAGELLNYTITVSNTGPSDAKNVVVVDELPNAGALNDPLVTYISDTDACYQDSIERAKLTCSLGDIPAAGSTSFDILVLVNPDVVERGYTTITNTVTVSSDTEDPFAANNTFTETTAVTEEADIYITKTDTPDPVVAGTQMRYLVTFGNRGPSVARTVTVTDTLPPKFAFNRCEPIDPDDEARCLVSGTYPNTQTITLDFLETRGVQQIPGDLDVDEEHSFYIVVDVSSSYVLDKGVFDPLNPTPPNPAVNTAYVASLTPDTRHPEDNQDTEWTAVLAEADLSVTKTDTPDPSLPDEYLKYDPVSNHFVFTYTITIRNNGPSDSAVVLFEDTLPTDAEFLAWEIPDDMRCVFRDDGTVICLVGNDLSNTPANQRGRLNDTSEISFTITARVDADSTPRILENRAEVQAVSEADARVYFTTTVATYLPDTTPTADPDLSNNVYIEETTVANPGVRIDKKAVLGRDLPTEGLTPAEIDEICQTKGVDDFLALTPAQATYCYFVYNEGDTWLTNVEVTDAPTANIVETAGPFVNVIGRAGTGSQFNLAHALWASIENDADSEVAPLAPAGQVHPDGYTYLLAVRAVTLDFADGDTEKYGENTATVTADPCTKYSTLLPGVPAVDDIDLLHDTLALPVLEDTTKEWAIYEDSDGDGLPSPGDVIEYTATISNTGIIEATGVEFYDELYNWIALDNTDLRVPGILINGSVSAAIHVKGRDPITGREIDADVAPPDLALGDDLLLRTHAPAVGGGFLELTYLSAVVLDGEILLGNTPGDDEVEVATRLAIPPVGYLLRFDGVTYDPPIPVTFSLRIKYQVRIKDTKYVRLGTIVLNHGWVTYDEIGLFDQRYPQFNPANVKQFFDSNREANYHAGTPGRAWERPEFPGWPAIPADVEPTNYPGERFDYYALPDAALRGDDDPTWFKLVREPRRIQLPAIDNEDGWETLINVQNGGDDETGAIVFFWGGYSGMCPYSDPGPVGSACKRVAKNGLWLLEDQIIPSTAKSGIVYSVDGDLYREACRDAADAVDDTVAWEDWEDEYAGTGEPIAVVVQRTGPNEHGTMVSSAYPGISENSVGGGPEYRYFAPYAMRLYHGLDTEMIIHNSGEECTQVWLDYQKQGDDVFSYSDHIAQLAPGESIRKRVPEVLGVEWLGSIYITADEPLGIIVDQTSFLSSDDRGTLLTYEARPYRLTTDTLFYADLVWRELSGWEASIQVQNLTQHSLPTFVTVEFFDASGDSILFLGDWVPRAGGATFYLPAVTDLGMGYAGAAVIQSHQQVDYPGQHHPNGEPIFAVVDLKKIKMYDESLPGWRHTIAGETQGGAYNALAEGEKKEASAVMLPFLAKAKNDQGVTSLMAIRNNSNCNQIELKLEVRKGTGAVVSYVHIFNLPPGHIKLIDLANVGSVNPGFVGAGAVRILDVDQLCDVDNDGEMDETPTMLSVVVVNKGAGSGDITSVYEGIPVAYWGFP